jgi:hypothetical protein
MVTLDYWDDEVLSSTSGPLEIQILIATGSLPAAKDAKADVMTLRLVTAGAWSCRRLNAQICDQSVTQIPVIQTVRPPCSSSSINLKICLRETGELPYFQLAPWDLLRVGSLVTLDNWDDEVLSSTSGPLKI